MLIMFVFKLITHQFKTVIKEKFLIMHLTSLEQIKRLILQTERPRKYLYVQLQCKEGLNVVSGTIFNPSTDNPRAHLASEDF